MSNKQWSKNFFLFGFLLIIVSLTKEMLAPPSSGHTTHSIPTGGGGLPTNPPIVPPSQATGVYAESSYVTVITEMSQLFSSITEYIGNSLGNFSTTYSLPANGSALQYGYLPVRAQNIPIQTVFQNFYNQIFNGVSIPSTSAPSYSYLTIFNNLLSLFQTYNSGSNVDLIFFPAGGLYAGPLDLFSNVQTAIVEYISLATKNITELNYATEDAINFLGNGMFFSTTPTSTVVGPNQAANLLTCPNINSGTQESCFFYTAQQLGIASSVPSFSDSHVAQLNNFVNAQLYTPLNEAFISFQNNSATSSTTISSTVADQNYNNAYNNYLFKVSGIIANWGYSIIQELATIYNPQMYLNGVSVVDNPNVNFYGIPNCLLLDNYGSITITAINQLALAAQALNLKANVSNTSFQGSSATITGLSLSGQNFVGKLNNTIYTNLAQIAAYAAFRNLELAGKYANGSEIPSTVSSNNTLSVQGSTNTINSQQTAQQLSATGALQLKNQTIPVSAPTVDPSVIAQAVLECVLYACQYFNLASQYYGVIQNTLEEQFYTVQTDTINNLLNYWVQGIQSVSNAPSPTTNIAGYINSFNIAQTNFNTTAELFYQMGQINLGLYLQKISAQAGIIEYQEALNALTTTYTPFISGIGGYINYANFEPIVSTTDWLAISQGGTTTNSVNAAQQESNFENIITDILQEISGAQTVYTEELSFYNSLGANATVDEQQVAADLLATTQIFQHLSSGLSTIGYLADLLGANYAAATSFPDVLDTIIASETMFIEALNQLKQADTLISKATPGVLDYVQLQNLFINQDSGIYGQNSNSTADYYNDCLPKITTFYDLAYLHRARLCYHGGQILAAANEPLALYLFWTSFTLYQELSVSDLNAENPPFSWAYNNASKVYGNTISPYENANQNAFNQIFTEAQALSKSLQVSAGSQSATLTSDEISLLYQKLMKIYFVLFCLDPGQMFGENSGQSPFSLFINDANSAISWYQGEVGQTSSYANLQLVMVYYQIYLMTYSSNIQYDNNGNIILPHVSTSAETSALASAQQLLSTFKAVNQIDPKSNSTPVVIPLVPTDDQFNQLSIQLQMQANSILAVQQAQINQELFEAYYYLTPGSVQELDFSVSAINFSEQLGNLYYNYANSLLNIAKTSFTSGQSYNNVVSNNAMYTTIISSFQQAVEYFNQAGMVAESLQAQQGVSSAVAFQIYSWVIPVRMCNISMMSGDQTLLGNIPLAWCQSDVELIQSYSTNNSWPDYVLNYSETLIPDSLVVAAQPYLNKTVTTSDILTNLVIPLKKSIYTQALASAGKNVDLTSYLVQDQNFAQALLSGSVKAASGLSLISSYSVITKTNPITGVLNYYLVGNNTPLSAMPRFAGELESAYYYYSQGVLPIFLPGNQPVNVSGQLLLPASDPTAVTSVNAELFNINYLGILSAQSQLNQFLVNPIYTQLIQLTPAQLLTMTSSSNLATLTIYNNFYNNSLCPTFIDLLANYENTIQFLKTMSINPALVTFVQTGLVKAYIQAIIVGKNFLFGDPTGSDNMYSFYLSPLLNYKDLALVLFSNNGVIASEVLSLNNQLISLMCGILENAGDILVNIPTSLPTINYPDSTATYPILSAGWSSPQKWQDASNYYEMAINEYMIHYQLTAGNTPTYGMPSIVASNDVALRLHGKLSLATYNDAIYRLAIFGNSAFQQCLCKLYSGPIQTVTTPATATTAAVTTTTQVSNVFETVTLAQSVETDGLWHQNVDTSINSNYSPAIQGTIVCNSLNGYSSITPFPGSIFSSNIYGVFQGVATQFSPEFQSFLVASSAQCSTNTFNNGPGSSACSSNAAQVSTCLQKQYLLQAISSLSLLASPGDSNNPAPLVSIQNLMTLSNKNTETYNAVNIYLCGKYTQDSTGATVVTQPGVFNSNPGFATYEQIMAADAKTNPIPLVYPALSIFQNIQTTTNGVSASVMTPLPIVVGSQLNPESSSQSSQNGGNILSDGNILYIPTLEYWSSLSRFLADMQQPSIEWLGNPYAENFVPIDPATFFSWVNGLNMMAQNIYGNVYLPFSSGVDLLQQINTELATLEQGNNSNANQYVG